MSRVRAFFFDADGVVQSTPAGFIDGLRALVPPSGRAAFLDAVFKAEEPCLRGEGDFAAALGPVLRQWRVSRPLSRVLALWEEIRPAADVLDVVQELRRAGRPCYLATNQQALRAAHMRRRLGYDALFDAAFYSCDLGAAKPDASFFSAMLARVPHPAAECLFIDDKKANTAAAAAQGLEALRFDLGEYARPGEELRAQLGLWTAG